MLPVHFEGAREIKKPESMTDEECSSLSILQGMTTDGAPFTLSCWKPSKEDIESINRGEPIWVRVLSHVVNPISLFTTDEAGNIN